MKKLLLSICAILTLSTAAQAATGDTLTLTVTNIKSRTTFAGRDYLRNVWLDSSNLPNFNSTGYVDWDLRGKIRYDTISFPVKTRLYAITPNKYADSIPHKLGQIYFYGSNLTDLDITQGLYSMGEALDSQNVYTPRIPSGTDTFVINPVTNLYQNSTNTGFAYYHQFPPTVGLGTTWQNGYNHTVSFLLTDYLQGYASTPGKFYFMNTRADTITGIGTIRMVMPNGDTTKRLKILKDKVITSETDSFTINGNPFPTALLNVFGVAQGMTTKTWSYCFYRDGRLTTPIMQVWYTNSSFTTVSKVWVDTNYVATVAAVPTIGNTTTNDITVYPNPVTNHVVNLDIANNNGVWSCQLISVTGQQVAAGNFAVASGHAQVVIPAAVTPGIYYLRINNNGMMVATKPLTIK